MTWILENPDSYKRSFASISRPFFCSVHAREYCKQNWVHHDSLFIEIQVAFYRKLKGLHVWQPETKLPIDGLASNMIDKTIEASELKYENLTNFTSSHQGEEKYIYTIPRVKTFLLEKEKRKGTIQILNKIAVSTIKIKKKNA